MPLESTVLPALHFQHKLEPAGPGTMVLLLGIEFLQAVNVPFSPLQDATLNSMAMREGRSPSIVICHK